MKSKPACVIKLGNFDGQDRWAVILTREEMEMQAAIWGRRKGGAVGSYLEMYRQVIKALGITHSDELSYNVNFIGNGWELEKTK